MLNLQKLKKLYTQYRTLNFFRRNTKIVNKDVLIENITDSYENYYVNKFINSLIKKYPNHNFTFNNCIIDELFISKLNNSTIRFINCKIHNLETSNCILSNISFESCVFNYNDNNSHEYLIVKTNNIDFDNCIFEWSNRYAVINLGNKKTNSVSFRNHSFNINSNTLTFSNYNHKKSVDNVMINMVNRKSISEYINMDNSVVNFLPREIKVKMFLIGNSIINRLMTSCNSIELYGDCYLNKVKIMNCNDIMLDQESGLVIDKAEINCRLLECQEKSEIIDRSNRFKWLCNINNIITHKNFKLKYKNITIFSHEKISTYEDAENLKNIVKVKTRRYFNG